MLAVAHNTFRESVRDKVLYVLLFFAAVTIAGSKVLGWVSIGQDIKIVKDISLGALSVFGVLIAIFVGTSLIYKEIDKRTIYTIICRPMARHEFIFGKYLGLAGLLLVVVAAMTAMAAAYVAVLGGALDGVFFLAALLVYVKLLLVTALALLMSSLVSPILGAIIVFCAYVLGHGTGILADLPKQLQGSPAEPWLKAVYYVLPNLSNFDIRAEAANDLPISGAYVAWAVVYGALYTAVLLALAALAFEGRDV
jgi:ABC-type transport system involved in multi-copper enzyme maturation permease subunit